MSAHGRNAAWSVDNPPMEPPPEVEVVIEVPRWSFLKRGSSGAVDFVSPLPCPFNYGAVPTHLGLEGDLLDAVVLGPRLRLGARLRVKAWGACVLSSATTLEEEFGQAARAFLAQASARLDERARQKLEKRIDELSGRLAQALATALEHDVQGPRSRWPFLPRMADMFRKDSIAQERFLSLIVPMLFHGDDAWRAIDGVAAQWAADALDGRVWHGVYSV